MNFRRCLKNLIKNTQRSGDYDSVREELAKYGLYCSFYSLCYAMKSPLFYKTKSRHFRRLGKAALRQGKLVPLMHICWYVRRGMDLRDIEFIVRSKYENPI
jgi:hypothetical protein